MPNARCAYLAQPLASRPTDLSLLGAAARQVPLMRNPATREDTCVGCGRTTAQDAVAAATMMEVLACLGAERAIEAVRSFIPHPVTHV